MARYGMVIDTRTCVGCMDCVVACKTENQVPEGFNRDWIAYETTGTFPTPHLEIRTERCNHCDNPPCVTCCPTGASHVEEPGPRRARDARTSASAARRASRRAPTTPGSCTPTGTRTSARSASTG